MRSKTDLKMLICNYRWTFSVVFNIAFVQEVPASLLSAATTVLLRSPLRNEIGEPIMGYTFNTMNSKSRQVTLKIFHVFSGAFYHGFGQVAVGTAELQVTF